jgi:hypothetical protein
MAVTKSITNDEQHFIITNLTFTTRLPTVMWVMVTGENGKVSCLCFVFCGVWCVCMCVCVCVFVCVFATCDL